MCCPKCGFYDDCSELKECCEKCENYENDICILKDDSKKLPEYD